MRKPCLSKGENIVLQSQGTLNVRPSWRLGHLFLTDKRLVFIHVTKKIFDVELNRITGISIVKRDWLLGVKVKKLCIAYNIDNRKEQVYIALGEPKKWSDSIKECMARMLLERWG